MGLHKSSPPVCPRNLDCSEWIRTYLKYCLCSVKDGVSLSLGLVSVISWGFAEVPQIITNYKQKTTEGLSITFLMTWIVGDLFNLIGCLLEPATLPTQYYMAMLYTITTVVLAAQTIYYGHIYNRRGHKAVKPHQAETEDKGKQDNIAAGEKQAKLEENLTNGSNVVNTSRLSSSPIPVTRYGSPGRDLYYMSARSLTRSHTPTVGSYLAHSRGNERSVNKPNSVEEPLLGGTAPTKSAPPLNTKSLLCVVSAVIFLFSGCSLHLSASNRFDVLKNPPQGVVIRVGRKLFQTTSNHVLKHGGEGSTGIGTILGWAMAAIYMGGRLPQIFLNMRRGNVEGLNPFMFILAIVGNATYVASILVNSLDWSKVKPNLPWLVDAGGCILLDVFILLQFIYFHHRKPKDPKNNDFTAS